MLVRGWCVGTRCGHGPNWVTWGGCGKLVQRAERGPEANESAEGDPWLVCMHHIERKGAEEQEQGAAVVGAPVGVGK